MGCFECNGGISKLPITYGDKCVLFIGVVPKEDRLNDCMNFGIGFKFTPTCLPIKGTYDDYGRIENIERDKNVEFIESVVEDTIENLIEAIDNVMADRYKCNDKNETLSNKYLQKVVNDTIGLYDVAFLLEHEFIYKSILNMGLDVFYDFKESILFTKKMPSTIDEFIEKQKSLKLFVFIDYEGYFISSKNKKKLGDNIINVNPNFSTGMFKLTYRYDTTALLSIYKGDNVKILFNDLFEQYNDFLIFFEKLNELDFALSIHNYSGQNGKRNLTLMESYFNDILNFINDKKEENYA